MSIPRQDRATRTWRNRQIYESTDWDSCSGDRGSGIGDRSYLELRAPGMSRVGGDAIAPLERLDQDHAGGEAADVRPERDAAAPALGHDAGDAAEKLERHPVQQHHP